MPILLYLVGNLLAELIKALYHKPTLPLIKGGKTVVANTKKT